MTAESRYCICGGSIRVSIKGDDASKEEVLKEWESWHSDHHDGHAPCTAEECRRARRRNERLALKSETDAK